MATITRVQHFQNDTVSLLAVQGKGTDTFRDSGRPDFDTMRSIGAVFTGNIRVTNSTNSGGYFILSVDAKRGSDRKRVFFRGSAQVRIAEVVMTMDEYYSLLRTVERLDALFG